METNSCLAIPSNEDGELTVYASTQNPTEGQKLIAHALNISMNKVVVKVKRLGGGFGGKETRCTPLIVAAAFAASKVNLPVKFSLDRDQVIRIQGCWKLSKAGWASNNVEGTICPLWLK